RIGVKRGSAYDLYLTRTLRHATVVRGDEGVDPAVTDPYATGRPAVSSLCGTLAPRAQPSV
ncbi:hypothetical protein AB0I01_35250, partial [Streptomyces sp. NPDC050848]